MQLLRHVCRLVSISSVLCIVLFASPLLGFATQSTISSPVGGAGAFSPSPLDAVSWLFSGQFSTDNGARYAYFFRLDKRHLALSSHAVLFDLDNETLLLNQQGKAVIKASTPDKWLVANAVLSFKPISDSWVLAMQKKASEIGFNVKTNLPRASQYTVMEQNLSADMALFLTATDRANGHISFPKTDNEAFVFAKRTLFEQLACHKPCDKPHRVTSLQCHFDDKSTLYSVTLAEKNAKRATTVGLLDADGRAKPVSQFIKITHNAEKDTWHIKAGGPNPFKLVLHATKLNQASTHFGFVTGTKKGVCFLQETHFVP